MRAITSGLAPADCETMKVMGRCGQVCAAVCAAADPAIASAAIETNAAIARMQVLPNFVGNSTLLRDRKGAGDGSDGSL